MSDQFVMNVFNKYHVKKELDPLTNMFVITPLHNVVKEWAGSCLNGVEFSGSRAKGTATTLSSDFDLFISLKHDTDNTLKEIYDSLFNFLVHKGYKARKQNVSIGVHHWNTDVDLVPAKKHAGNTNDHSLFISKQGTWRQTNVSKHINMVKNSGRIVEIVLLKVWRKLHNLDFPSIYLELTVLEALKGRSKSDPANNFLVLLDYLRDEFVDKTIVDPANTNNVISDDLYKYEKDAIRKKAKESRSQQYWKDIIW